MLQNWITPLVTDSLGIDQLHKDRFGRHVSFFQTDQDSLSEARLAIIGLDTDAANAVRQKLYSFSWPFEKLKITDLGNTRRSDPAFLVPLLRELLDSKIFPLLIGQTDQALQAMYQAFLQLKPHISLALIDEEIPLSARKRKDPNLYLNEIIHGKHQDLFHLSLIGSQLHLCDPTALRLLDRRHYEYIRLGSARADLSELEPSLRDADLAAFNLGCIRASEAPEVEHPSPSGFFTEEACRICRYAGMSDKLRAFGLFGLPSSAHSDDMSVQTAAQLLWYFIDGFYHRKNDFPVTNTGLTEYIVSFKHRDTNLTFWKSNRSGRWWIQAPVDTDEDVQRHRLIPCSYSDYQAALREELPDRLVNAFQRFQ